MAKRKVDAISYGIKTELLGSDEKVMLKSLGVDLHPSGISFKRKLLESEMRLVVGILISLKNRTDDEGNHINFAVGDCVLKVDEWFGTGAGVQWFAEEKTRKAYRDHLLALVGATLIQVQGLENLIRGICSWLTLGVNGKTLTVSDFLSTDPSRIRATLGDLKEALKARRLFDSRFEVRLHEFVLKRNRFVHSFWVETFNDPSTTGTPPSFETLKAVEGFLAGLLREGTEIEAVFKGICYSIGKELSEATAHQDPFVEWSVYEQAFRSVQKI